MLEPITIRYAVSPKRRSLAAGQVADLFGLAFEEPPMTVAENVSLDIRPGDVVLFFGPSGSGKSSLLREAGKQLNAVDLAALDLPDLPLIECLTGPVSQRMELLSACGLAEARLMLRTPSELSDGQRARFRIAFGIAHRGERMFLMNDEFGAVLDRTLAQVVAFNVRKLCTKTGLGFLGATTHDDLIDDLNPNLMVTCRGDGEVAVERRDVKKKRSALPMIFGCRPVPSPIGRTSLGGIIAAITSPSPNE